MVFLNMQFLFLLFLCASVRQKGNEIKALTLLSGRMKGDAPDGETLFSGPDNYTHENVFEKWCDYSAGLRETRCIDGRNVIRWLYKNGIVCAKNIG